MGCASIFAIAISIHPIEKIAIAIAKSKRAINLRCEGTLRCVQTERKRKFSLIFAIYSLIFFAFACSLIFSRTLSPLLGMNRPLDSSPSSFSSLP